LQQIWLILIKKCSQNWRKQIWEEELELKLRKSKNEEKERGNGREWQRESGRRGCRPVFFPTWEHVAPARLDRHLSYPAGAIPFCRGRCGAFLSTRTGRNRQGVSTCDTSQTYL
jgi:hypothetical protein